MATFVSEDWLEEQLGRPGLAVIDPRSPMRYLQGHLKSAVNLPLRRLTDAQGQLLAVERLADVIGTAGLGDKDTPVLYDGTDGRNAAMLGWLLEYLGRQDVHIMESIFEQWASGQRPLFYRPVATKRKSFTPRINASLRAGLSDVSPGSKAPLAQLVDLRSREEYLGDTDIDNPPGHIPGAVNIIWQELVGRHGNTLSSDEETQRVLDAAGLSRSAPVVAYCRSGPRAAVGYLALRRLGYDVKLYDGSYAEYAKSGLPVETAPT